MPFEGAGFVERRTTEEVLLSARAFIADKKDWVQGRYKTRSGRRCAFQALRDATLVPHWKKLTSFKEGQTILLQVANERGFCRIQDMNDESDHKQVLAAFDEAIARARAHIRMFASA